MDATHKVRYANEAQGDLDRIYAYVLDRSGDPRTADRYVGRIKASCDALSVFPERGTRRDDLQPGLRTMGFERRATVVFVVGSTEVTILRIHFGGRDCEAEFYS